MDTAVEQWQELEQKALRGGGISRIERQYAQGKQTARDRLAMLLDPNSFTEIDRLAISPFLEEKAYTDGVITGFGRVNGRPVAVYAQDFTIKGGSLGKRHADKICKVMDMAAKVGCPIIGIIDSGGARIDEGIHALAGYGQIFRRNSMYSGVVPQISIILGPCAGGAAYSPGLTDFVFMTENISQMFITGPQVIEEAMHQTVTKEALGGASVHATTSGVAHVQCANEADCFTKLKALLSYLPSSYMDESASAPTELRRDRSPQGPDGQSSTCLADSVPSNFTQGYDMHTVIANLVDANTWFELQQSFAANILTGFARMDGMTIGLIANQPMVKAGCVDIDASCKAARFIRFCDSFNIPIISLVDTPGFLPGVEQEHDGIIRHGAKLLYAYATATVPKITLVLRKAFGGAYVVMGSKELGADFNFAWPSAHIAVLGAKAAVTILHGRALATAGASEREALETAYAQEFLNPLTAAQYGYIDAVIAPHETRQQLVQALHITKDKVERLPARKHGNIPL